MNEPSSTESQGSGRSPAGRDRSRDVRLVVVGVCAVLLIWFAVANLRDASVRFWIFDSRAPMIVVIVVAFLLGVVLTLLVTRLRQRRRGSGAEAEGQ
jgi:uncharacterized integral membrane protein